MGGSGNPHRERGPGWAHCLGKRRFGPAFRRQIAEFGEKVLHMLTEECDCRLASGFLLRVSWYSLGARSFLRLPEAEPNDPSLLLSPWSSLGPVVLHAQLPPDPVGPAPVPGRVCRACSSAAASQHRQGRVVPMLKLVGHGSKLRCVQRGTWSLARQRWSSPESLIGVRMDETKKKKNVLFGEDVDFRLGVEEFRTSSSSSCGAARPSDGSTTSSSGEATIHLLSALASETVSTATSWASNNPRGIKRDVRVVGDELTTTAGDERDGSFFQGEGLEVAALHVRSAEIKWTWWTQVPFRCPTVVSTTSACALTMVLRSRVRKSKWGSNLQAHDLEQKRAAVSTHSKLAVELSRD